MNPDFYDILNIPNNAPQGSIARSAQARLREIGDDMDLSAADKQAAAAAVHEAHDTLGDAAKRAQYDADLQQWREDAAKPKPKVKQEHNYSYPKIGLAVTILFAVAYLSISGYLGYKDRLAAERAAATQLEAKKQAEEDAGRAARAAARDEERRIQAELKKIDQERLLKERGVKVVNPTLDPAAKR